MFDMRIPEGIRTRLMKAFIRHLKEHPTLRGVIKKWDDYDGGAHDHEVIPLEQCPAVRFTYSSQGMSPQSFSSTSANFSIEIEMIVPGTNQYQVIDLWEVIETAIDQFFGGEKAMHDALKGDRRAIYGTHFISSPAINHAKYKNPPCMVGNGSVSIVLSIRR